MSATSKVLAAICVLAAVVLIAVFGFNLGGGKGETEKAPASAAESGAPATPDKKIKLLGAGASFPYPLYSRWMHEYRQMYGVEINYQSIGSGGGIAQIKAKTVDFGASDAPLKKADLDAAGLVQFPMTMGGVVIVVNLGPDAPSNLKIPRKAVVDIFLGRVRKWNDPAIKKANPGVSLPDMEITVVHRSDGSGTSWIFTNYLSAVSSEWKNKVGAGKVVDWPVGVGGKGNEGVAAYVQRVKGAIGYVEYAYAIQNKLTAVSLQNKAGNYVEPSLETFQAAAANADWENAPGFYMVLVDQPGAESWPITGASFILVYKDQPDAEKAKAMLEFFMWCYRHGGDTAEKLHYVPIPANVVSIVENMWKREIKHAGTLIWR